LHDIVAGEYLQASSLATERPREVSGVPTSADIPEAHPTSTDLSNPDQSAEVEAAASRHDDDETGRMLPTLQSAYKLQRETAATIPDARRFLQPRPPSEEIEHDLLGRGACNSSRIRLLPHDPAGIQRVDFMSDCRRSNTSTGDVL